MEIHIRTADVEDLAQILHHRRAMFEEMGFLDKAVLARVNVLSEEYFREALKKDTYKGWLAEHARGKWWAAAGLWLPIGRAIPASITVNEFGF